MSESTHTAAGDTEAGSVPVQRDRAAVPGRGGATESRGPLATLRRTVALPHLGLLAVIAVLCLVGAATGTAFNSWDNWTTILSQASVYGVVSVGMTFVIIGGGIDLSVGAIIALASVWATTAATQSYGFWVMVFVSVVVGLGAGLVNGVLIARFGMVPFIATLAMLASARGLAERISNRQSQIVKVQSFADLAARKVLGVPLLVIILVVVAAAGWLLLNRTTFGRRTFAVGGNAEAARLAGINVRRHTLMLYALSGLLCGIAAVMLAARANTGASTHGQLYELDAIAAVIIGGTAMTGGRGSLVGTILGVIIFTAINNLFVLNNLSTDTQNIAKGVIIVVAVLMQRRAKEQTAT